MPYGTTRDEDLRAWISRRPATWHTHKIFSVEWHGPKEGWNFLCIYEGATSSHQRDRKLEKRIVFVLKKAYHKARESAYFDVYKAIQNSVNEVLSFRAGKDLVARKADNPV